MRGSRKIKGMALPTRTASKTHMLIDSIRGGPIIRVDSGEDG